MSMVSKATNAMQCIANTQLLDTQTWHRCNFVLNLNEIVRLFIHSSFYYLVDVVHFGWRAFHSIRKIIENCLYSK